MTRLRLIALMVVSVAGLIAGIAISTLFDIWREGNERAAVMTLARAAQACKGSREGCVLPETDQGYRFSIVNPGNAFIAVAVPEREDGILWNWTGRYKFYVDDELVNGTETYVLQNPNERGVPILRDAPGVTVIVVPNGR